MILKSLELENIRSYVREKVEFPEGSLMLSGDVGAGKSTILLALEFALFGLLKGKLSGNTLLRHNASKGQVILKMDIDGTEIGVMRSLKRQNEKITQNNGYISIDGEKLEVTPTELKFRVLSLLGYPQSMLNSSKLIYRYTVYTPQEGMKAILADEKDARMDTLRKVFGIDKYKLIIENTGVVAKDLRSERKVLSEKGFEFKEKKEDLKKHEEKLNSLHSRVKELEPRIEELTCLIENSKEDLEEIEKKLVSKNELLNLRNVALARLKEKRINLEKNFSDINRSVAELYRAVAKADTRPTPPPEIDDSIKGLEEEQIVEEIEKKERLLRGLREEFLKKQMMIKNIAREKDQLEKEKELQAKAFAELQKKKNEFENLKSEIIKKEKIIQQTEKLEQSLKEARSKLSSVETNRSNAKKTISDISLMRKCPTCFQEVTREHKMKIESEAKITISSHDEILDILRKNILAEETTLNELKTSLETIRSKEKILGRIEAEINTLTEKISKSADIDLRLSEIAEIIKSANFNAETDIINEEEAFLVRIKESLKLLNEHSLALRERAHLEDVISSKAEELIRFLSEKQMLESGFKDTDYDIRTIEEKLSNFDGLDETRNAIRSELEKLMLKERQHEIAKAELNKEISGTEELRNYALKSINNLEKDVKRAEKLGLVNNWLSDHFSRLVETIEKHVMLCAYHEFNDSFSSWFDLLMEDDSISVRLDEKFAPVITQNGYEVDFSGLSGGERTSVALAYRLALNRVINDVTGLIRTKDLIILDEPTDGFSSYQLDRVKEVISQLNVRQAIIVSHESKIESFVDNVLRVVKTGHESHVLL